MSIKLLPTYSLGELKEKNQTLKQSYIALSFLKSKDKLNQLVVFASNNLTYKIPIQNQQFYNVNQLSYKNPLNILPIFNNLFITQAINNNNLSTFNINELSAVLPIYVIKSGTGSNYIPLDNTLQNIGQTYP